ncbi:hypothetical protein BKA70DRAFT_1423679 [Coprinopsis sp. MPI-PUGE-AT-0042]|nr:hypothetical protein BKA70DRAFT_1423679 [Coprinopsis sp. MPI-PUGE-AT-0042]
MNLHIHGCRAPDMRPVPALPPRFPEYRSCFAVTGPSYGRKSSNLKGNARIHPIAALAVVCPVFVLAASQGSVDSSGPKAGGYVVKLKSGARKSAASTLEVPAGATELGIINGFSGDFDEETVKALIDHESTLRRIVLRMELFPLLRKRLSLGCPKI